MTVDPQGRGISGVELKIEFDPAVLQMIDVVPWTLLGEKPEEVRSTIPFTDIDNTLGTLHYADVRVDVTHPPTPPGLLATIKLRVLETAKAGRDTSLRIVDVKIPDENIREIQHILIESETLTVRVSP